MTRALARIFHQLRGASLALRLHSAFFSLANTDSIRSVEETPGKPNARAIRSRLGEICGLALLAFLIGFLLADTASTQDSRLPTRAVRAALVEGTPRVGFDATHFADQQVLGKLQSGLPQTLVMRVALRPQGRTNVVAASAQSCRVLYDLWEGSYRVQLDRPGTSTDLTLRSAKQVVDRCLRASHLPLATDGPQTFRDRRFYFSVVVELNPLSQATVKRIRRWLSQSGGSQLGGDAFFGSFVSIFVGREIGTAEKTLSFRSRAWTVAK